MGTTLPCDWIVIEDNFVYLKGYPPGEVIGPVRQEEEPMLVSIHTIGYDTMSSSNSFYRYFLNPLMRSLLRSPLHGITSRNIGIVHFSGRKSGRKLSTPLSYTREGNTVRLLSNRSTQWWLNFRGDGVKVEMEIARQRYPGTAILLEGDSERLREGVRRFIRALPRDAKVYGLQLNANGEIVATSLAAIADQLILVEIQLDA